MRRWESEKNKKRQKSIYREKRYWVNLRVVAAASPPPTGDVGALLREEKHSLPCALGGASPAPTTGN